MNNPMLQGLQEKTNRAYTTNGALVRESTGTALLDFFSKGGALRNNPQESVRLFDMAFDESPELAVKAMFYFRDVRGGQGERNTFHLQLRHLLKLSPDTVVKNLPLIAEYGRWDDMFAIFGGDMTTAIVKLVKTQLFNDISNLEKDESISLLAKWMPTVGAGTVSTRLAHKLARRMKITDREYRKLIAKLRENLNVVERKMSRNQWGDIDYSTVSSNAMMKNRRAFKRHDEARFEQFVDAVNSGEETINASTLYPYEIVEKCRVWNTPPENYNLLNAQWNALPDYTADGVDENSIAVVDTSGSMSGDPMNVAISLGIYLGERAKGAYKDHFITFSANPKLQKIEGTDIVKKVQNLSRAQWDINTNLEKVFMLILNVALEKNLSQEDMIDKLYIISDMQFDSCVGQSDKTMFQHLAGVFQSHGYVIPKLVFWNVRASVGNTPMSLDDRGFQNVSGLSPSIFKYLMTGEFKDATGLMLDVLESERYQAIVL